jgi:hypothetical protein
MLSNFPVWYSENSMAAQTTSKTWRPDAINAKGREIIVILFADHVRGYDAGLHLEGSGRGEMGGGVPP